MKCIVIACDGTGQSASRGANTVPTNVTRLCRALSHSPDAPHIIFYQSGIGTQDLAWGMGTVIQALGSGLEDHVADAYTFLMNNYQPGDKIYIFGFSRGAFTARVLANITAKLGIIKKTHSSTFKDAMSAYGDGKLKLDGSDFVTKIKPEEFDNLRLEDCPATPAYDVEIEVVGCWDTVASLGVPWRPVTNAGKVTGDYKHYDGSLVKGIKNAFHALGLDECRGPFSPTLWYLPEELKDSINLKQCWFPGVHTNVGGGYTDRALANITLAWMIDQCRPFLPFDEDYVSQIVKLDRDPEAWHKRNAGKKEEYGEEGFSTKYQGWGRGRCIDSYKRGETWSWKYRTPGDYHDGDGETNETIHASARERWKTSREKGLTYGPPVWEPVALKGFQPTETGGAKVWVKEENHGLWHWMMNGIAKGAPLVIPEEPFPTTDKSSMEWMLRYWENGD